MPDYQEGKQYNDDDDDDNVVVDDDDDDVVVVVLVGFVEDNIFLDLKPP